MNRLTKLPNIGPTLAGKLESIGINTIDQLQSIGSVEAVLKINENDLTTCYNMLFALEGAIQGIRWHSIPKEEREIIKEEFNRLIKLK